MSINVGQTNEPTKRKPISKGVRFDIFHRDGFKCRYCGVGREQGATLHVDHVHPVSKGGANSKDNYVTACSDCNLGKSAKVLKAAPNPKGDIETFGLSFKPDGHVHWQFVIDKASTHAAQITTFSWLDGRDYSTQHVNADFLYNECLLFLSYDAFLKAADYWGDFRTRRINPMFVRE